MEGALKISSMLKAALLLVLLGLVTRTNAQPAPQPAPQLATNCTNVATNISRCPNIIGSSAGSLAIPSISCCLSLRSIAEASTALGATETCRCLRNSPPLNATTGVALRVRFNNILLAYNKCLPVIGAAAYIAGDALILQCLGIVYA